MRLSDLVIRVPEVTDCGAGGCLIEYIIVVIALPGPCSTYGLEGPAWLGRDEDVTIGCGVDPGVCGRGLRRTTLAEFAPRGSDCAGTGGY